MRRFYLLAAALMVALVPRPADACSCLPSSQCQSVLYTSAIFVGRVVSIDDPKIERGQPAATSGTFFMRRVTFHVTERFIGRTDTEVTVRTGIGGGDCGFPFVVGTTYLVYANTTPDGAFATGICSRTQLAASAGDDLKYLRELTTTPVAEARALGQALSAGKPYKGARIVAQSGDRVISAVSDAEGKFELRGPAGVYRLKVEVPPGATAWVPPEASLYDSRGCGTITVSIQVAKLR